MSKTCLQPCPPTAPGKVLVEGGSSTTQNWSWPMSYSSALLQTWPCRTSWETRSEEPPGSRCTTGVELAGKNLCSQSSGSAPTAVYVWGGETGPAENMCSTRGEIVMVGRMGLESRSERTNYKAMSGAV